MTVDEQIAQLQGRARELEAQIDELGHRIDAETDPQVARDLKLRRSRLQVELLATRDELTQLLLRTERERLAAIEEELAHQREQRDRTGENLRAMQAEYEQWCENLARKEEEVRAERAQLAEMERAYTEWKAERETDDE